MPIAVRNRLTPDPHRVVGLSARRVNLRKQRQTDFHLILERRGVTLADVARAAGLSQSYISRIVTGVRTPSLQTTIDLAKVLGVTLPELASILLPTQVIP